MKVGDPVTVLYSITFNAGRKPVSHGHVISVGLVFKGWEMFEYQPDDGNTQLRCVDREGVTWLRGHHATSSPEVRAALVAWHLIKDEFLKPLKEKGT